MLRKENFHAMSEITHCLEKFRRIISKQGVEDLVDQTRSVLEICQHLTRLRSLVRSINSLCGKKLKVPNIDLKNADSSLGLENLNYPKLIIYVINGQFQSLFQVQSLLHKI